MSRFYSALIKLAHEEPLTREALVPVLRKYAMEFHTKDALEKYLKEHPGADRKNHSVGHSVKEHAQHVWRPTKKAFKKAYDFVKKNVVGEIKGEYRYWKDAAVAVKKLVVDHKMPLKEKRAAARVVLTESLAVVRNAALNVIFPGVGPIAFFGIKTAIAAASSKAIGKGVLRIFPGKHKKTAAESTLSTDDLIKIMREEFESALEEEFEQFNPESKKKD